MSKTIVGKTIKKANRHFFEKSGIRNGEIQLQHPYIAIIPKKSKTEIELVTSVEKLITMPKKTRVLAQWKGEKRSDFYKFSVKSLLQHIAENPKQENQKV